ncbi:hypothetical protein BDV97DRAFT_367010 [Delphinella strobiligena]|nr:hypothetical protein BDV97DRAFT_367010 [Delphinella strobiligena]
MGSQLPGSTINSQPYSYARASYSRGQRQINQTATVNSTAMALQTPYGEAPVQSAYPSPADEMNHSITPASPVYGQQHVSSPQVKPSLPPIQEMLRRPLSPSTSPHLPTQSYGALPGSSMPAPLSRNSSGNTYTDNLYRTADPQLFPEHAITSAAEYRQPLFPAFNGPHLKSASKTTHITPRQRKRTPQQSPLASPLEPARNRKLPSGMSVWARAAADPVGWYQDRRDEDSIYWPPSRRTQPSEADMARVDSSQGTSTISPALGKRALDRRDSATQIAPAKRQRREPEGNRAATRTTPREAPSNFFDTVMADSPVKATKPKRASTPAQSVRKLKPSSEEPDRAYELYDDSTPDLSTLNDPSVNFSASWAGKPLNLDNDPDRALLHEKEVKVASKLALSCARYLYLKRRFFAGRLGFAGKDKQVYNINAAQQQCKGQDIHGIVGADVNKTSAMWKAFNSVGWLDAKHMQPYLERRS